MNKGSQYLDELFSLKTKKQNAQPNQQYFNKCSFGSAILVFLGVNQKCINNLQKMAVMNLILKRKAN